MAGKKLTNAELQKRMEEQSSVTDDRLETVETTLTELGDAVGSIQESVESQFAEVLKSIKAINNPVSINTSRIEADEHLGGGGVRKFEHEGRLNDDDIDVIQPAERSDVGSPEFKNKMEALQFNEQELLVYIQDGQEDRVFSITVSGEECIFVKGRKHIAKRKFVEGLARAKPLHYSNELLKDAQGNDFYQHRESEQLRYPFSVEKDPAGDFGRAWLQRILKEP
jgi:hypothetical protein